MAVLLTGAAGFIGYHVTARLLERGEHVVGVDDLNDYYDVALKQARLDRLRRHGNFDFHRLDISDHRALSALAESVGDIDRLIHFAAQAGIRYSLINPFAYVQANLVGHMAVLELCRHLPSCKHLVYASSSSIYGGNTKLPFAVEDRTDTPVSLYAATKLSNELASHAYSHLYGMPQTGLRFFTVYGPWGRPDMAIYIFTKAITEGRPIRVFNNGDMKRDFTYIDDVVSGVIAALDNPPSGSDGAPHRLYNIGNHKSEPLMRLIELLEIALGAEAAIVFDAMQPGDVKETYADISAVQRDLGYAPSTPLDVGLPEFVRWYRDYHTD